MNTWAENEAKHMSFGDKRLNKRAIKMLEDLSENYEASIPEASVTHAATIGAYRFFDNENASSETIFEGFNLSTKERMTEHKLVLGLSDATSYCFTHRKNLTGTGVLKNSKARGYIMHSTFIVANGIGLGLIHQNLWGRKSEDVDRKKLRKKLPTEKKESFKWIEHLRKFQESLNDDQHGIYICDRDADMIDLFIENRKPNCDLLVRSHHNRKITGENKRLHEMLNEMPVMGEVKVKIKRAEDRKERTAILELKYKEITVTINKDPNKKATLYVIEAKEKTPNAEKTIHWILYTTMKLNSIEEAMNCVNLYSQRWLIERYHYALKQGCKIEQLQLEESSRMFSAIAMYAIIAWRIMSICYSARHEPNKSALEFFEKAELESLQCFYLKKTIAPKKIPSIKEAVLMLAKLGGFLGRNQDGDPGMKVIWRGIRRLEGFVEAYVLFTKGFQTCV